MRWDLHTGGRRLPLAARERQASDPLSRVRQCIPWLSVQERTRLRACFLVRRPVAAFCPRDWSRCCMTGGSELLSPAVGVCLAKGNRLVRSMDRCTCKMSRTGHFTR